MVLVGIEAAVGGMIVVVLVVVLTLALVGKWTGCRDSAVPSWSGGMDCWLVEGRSAVGDVLGRIVAVVVVAVVAVAHRNLWGSSKPAVAEAAANMIEGQSLRIPRLSVELVFVVPVERIGYMDCYLERAGFETRAVGSHES